MKHRIGIIGYGNFGQALEKVTLGASHQVAVWDRDAPRTSHGRKSLGEIASRADAIFLCVPAAAARDVLIAVRPHLVTRPRTVVVSASKGFEEETRMMVDEVLHDVLPPKQLFAFLGGPMLADELRQGLPGVAVIAAADRRVRLLVKDVFEGTPVRCEMTGDVRGVVVAAVLKNIYAMALGIVDGLGWGGNVKGWVVAEAEKEMVSIGTALGGKRSTIQGMAGFGDFIATATSPYSRNREAGEQLVCTGTVCFDAEGVHSLSPLVKRLSRSKVGTLPLLRAMRDILVSGKNVRFVFGSLLP